MAQESWAPTRGLRALSLANGVIVVGLWYVLLWFFFPHVLLVPVTAVVAVLFLALSVMPIRVRLDPGPAPDRGELAITFARWTRHVPLTKVGRVDEAGRLGARIALTDGWSFAYSPLGKHPLLAAWLRRRLRLRTGFEGMEAAVTQAVAAARAADPDSAPPGENWSARGASAVFLMLAAGLFSLAVAVIVQPQTGGWLVRAGAVVIRISSAAAAAAVVLIGALTLHQAWRDRHAPRAS